MLPSMIAAVRPIKESAPYTRIRSAPTASAALPEKGRSSTSGSVSEGIFRKADTGASHLDKSSIAPDAQKGNGGQQHNQRGSNGQQKLQKNGETLAQSKVAELENYSDGENLPDEIVSDYIWFKNIDVADGIRVFTNVPEEKGMQEAH